MQFPFSKLYIKSEKSGNFNVPLCDMKDSNGIHHLRRLCQAGITHVHLLPSFHFGGVDDEKNNWSYIGKFYF